MYSTYPKSQEYFLAEVAQILYKYLLMCLMRGKIDKSWKVLQ